MQKKIILSAIFILLISFPLNSQDGSIFKLFQNPEVPNGPVLAILPYGDTIFVGGSFHFWGPPIGSFGVFDLATGDVDLDFFRLSTPVYKILLDNSGGFYICGSGSMGTKNLLKRDGTSKSFNSIIHVNPDGNVDENFNAPSFKPYTNAPIHSMALYDTILFVLGNFQKVNDSSRTYLAALDARTGKVLPWKTDSIAFNSLWKSGIAVYDTTLYVYGDIQQVGDSIRTGIAAFDIRTGKLLPWNPKVKGEVHSIAVYNNIVYIGGDFDSVGTYKRSNLAAINKITGEVTNWAPNASSYVYALKVYGSKLFVGGSFERIDTVRRENIACFDLATGQLTNWQANVIFTLRLKSSTGSYSSYYVPDYFSLGVYDIEIVDSTLFIAGDNLNAFITTGTDTVIKYGIVALDLATGNLKNWDGCALYGDSPILGYSVYGAIINDLQVWGNKLLVGGELFSGQNIMGSLGRQVIERNIVAAIDAKTGKVIRGWKGPDFTFVECYYDKIGSWYSKTLAKYVSALAIDDSTLYVGGNMSLKGPHWYSYYCDIRDYPEVLVALDLKTGQVRRKWTFDKSEDLLNRANGYDGIKKILPTQNAIYVAGGLWWVKVPGSKIGFVVIDKSTGNILNWNAGLWGGARSVAIKNDTLFVAGWFTKVLDTIPRTYIAAFSTRLDSVKLLNWQSGPFQILYDSYNRLTATIWDMALEDSVIYICGSFITSGDSARERIASIYTRDGKFTGWKPSTSSLGSNYYTSIALTDSVVYFGGNWGVDAFSKRTAQKVSRRWHNNTPRIDISAIAVNPKYRHVYIGGKFFGNPDITGAYYPMPFFFIAPYAEDVLTSVEELNQLVILNDYKLYQNYPNPFNPSTKIEFEIPKKEHVKLIIYDILGREVKRVVDEELQMGRYTVNVDMSGYSSGVYFYRFEAGNFVSVKKMILLK